MKIKRIIAVAMCFIMTMLQFQTIAADTRQTEIYYYVSATGNDDNSGASVNDAFATVKKAVEAIETTETGNIIKILGEYTLTSSDFETLHEKMVVLEGNDENAKIKIESHLSAGGPFTFKNIELVYSDAHKGCIIYANGKEIVFDDNVTIAGTNEGEGWWSFQNQLSTSGTDVKTYDNEHQLTINSGDYYRLYVGNSEISTGQQSVIQGVDFVMNGGSALQFILGGNGWDTKWGTNSFTDDVNLTFNGGIVGKSNENKGGIVLSKYGVENNYFQGGVDFNGNALQIIMNNGTEIRLDTGLTATNVENCNGSLYILKCANQAGSTLEATETAGTYKVNGDMVAVASDGNNTYKSVAGQLVVPKGTYTVTWEEVVSDTLYVSSTGNDSNSGASEEKALATVKKAIEKLEATAEKNPTIKILGEYTLTTDDFAATHTKAVILEGNDENAKINIENSLYAGGPFTFRNIVLYYKTNDCMFFAQGHEIAFGENVKTSGTSGGWSDIMNKICTGMNYSNGTYATSHKLTINSGDYYRLYVGDSAISNTTTSVIPGFDLIMDNGLIYEIILGGNGWDTKWGTNSFTDDVNLTFNGGIVGKSNENKGGIVLSKYGVENNYFQGGVDFNGNALQIIMNNGTEIRLDTGLTATNVENCNGSLYILKCANQAGSTLEATETAGTYKVNGDMVAVASDGNNTYKSVAGQLVVPKGTYTVTWKEETVGNTVYVSATGSDDNTGTVSNPLKTISAAIEKLNSFNGDNKAIVLNGVYELENSLTVHTDMITIRGDGDSTTQLQVKTGCDLNGPTTFEALAVNVTAYDKYFNTNGNKLVMGANVTLADWRKMYLHMGTASSNGGHEEAIINSGQFQNIAIGSYYNNNYSYETAGADLIVNDGTIQNINVFADGWLDTHKGTTFADDVNITLNGGSVATITLTNADRPTIYNKAVQIILNNVLAPTISGIDDIQPTDGYWIMQSDVTGSLSATEKAGEFTVNDGMIAIATAKMAERFISQKMVY